MVSLLNRLKRESDSGNNIRGHKFHTVLTAYLRGHYTQAKAYNTLGINGASADRLAQQADFELFKTAYDAMTLNNQQFFLIDVLALTIELDDGDESKVQYNTDLGNLGLDTT